MATDRDQSTGWPLAVPWNLAGEQTDAPAGQPAPAQPATRIGWPPGGWPSHTQLSYTKELITVLLLVLALPWLVSKLLTRPGDVLTGLGQRQTGRAVS